MATALLYAREARLGQQLGELAAHDLDLRRLARGQPDQVHVADQQREQPRVHEDGVDVGGRYVKHQAARREQHLLAGQGLERALVAEHRGSARPEAERDDLGIGAQLASARERAAERVDELDQLGMERRQRRRAREARSSSSSESGPRSGTTISTFMPRLAR